MKRGLTLLENAFKHYKYTGNETYFSTVPTLYLQKQRTHFK